MTTKGMKFITYVMYCEDLRMEIRASTRERAIRKLLARVKERWGRMYCTEKIVRINILDGVDDYWIQKNMDNY